MPTSTERTVYLDSSALVKLAVREPETTRLAAYIRGRPRRATSAIARVELIRAARRHGPTALAAARSVLDRLDLIDVDETVLEAAALLDPSELRGLDAIHLASARALGPALDTLITYDARMAGAARDLGLPVRRPA